MSENYDPINGTKNYQKWNEIMQELKTIYIYIDNSYTVFRAIELFDQLKTEKHCPHCHGQLLLSDLGQYDYVCPECDENFFECEI